MTRAWRAVLAEHEQVIAGLAECGGVLDRIADAISECLRGGGRVYTLGNGGSAADAQHIACELIGRFKRQRVALPAMALTTDTSALTAIANDYDYDRVFARQVEGLARRGDVVWALSTSGDSPSVLEAVRQAAECGAVTVGFTGQSGGALATMCTHVFHAPHTSSDRIQEAHVLAYHYVCERVEGGIENPE